MGATPVFSWGCSELLIVLVFSVVLCFSVLFVYVVCLVCPMLPNVIIVLDFRL